MSKKVPDRIKAKARTTVYLQPRTLDLLTVRGDTMGINGALAMLASLVKSRTLSLAALLTPSDWWFMAQSCEGLCLAEFPWTDSPAVYLYEAVSGGAESVALMGTAWPEDAKGNHALLLKVIRKISDLDAVAILLACRHYHLCCVNRGDGEEWWLPHHRMGLGASKRLAEERARHGAKRGGKKL